MIEESSQRVRNREVWEHVSGQNASSSYGRSLRDEERRAAEATAGRRLLHLQCHTGAESLQWARDGWRVLGVDWAETAIATARARGASEQLEAAFRIEDLWDAPTWLAHEGVFDVVFVSEGSIWWMPDIERWAATVAAALAPGGRLVLSELHPITLAISTNRAPGWPTFRHYSCADDVVSRSVGLQYSGATLPKGVRPRIWCWGLGQILSAVCGAGLRVLTVTEYAAASFRQFPFLQEDSTGQWRPSHEMDLTMPLGLFLVAERLEGCSPEACSV